MDRRIYEMCAICFLFCTVAILMCVTDKIERRRQLQICFFLSILISFLSTIRSIGWDIQNYQELYSNYFFPFWQLSYDGITSLFGRSYEPMNYLLARVFGAHGFRLYLFTTCIIPFLMVYAICRRFEYPLLYFGAFFLINMSCIDTSRQFLAEGFFLGLYLVRGGLKTILLACLVPLTHLGSSPALSALLVKKKGPSQCGFLAILLIIFLSGLLLRFGGTSFLGVVSGRMNGYVAGFFTATSFTRLFTTFYPTLSMVSFLLIHAQFIIKRYGDEGILGQSSRFAVFGAVVFIALLFGTGSDVISVRIFQVISVGNFIIIGKYLSGLLVKGNSFPCILWLLSLDVCWSASMFFGYIS